MSPARGQHGRSLTGAVLACLALLAVGKEARAGYLAGGPDGDGAAQLTYTAADAELNRVTVTLSGSQQLALVDSGAAITVLPIGMATTVCPTGSGTNQVLCTLPPLRREGGSGNYLSLDLGDGDDQARSPEVHPRAPLSLLSFDVHGGSGNDLLEGSGLGALDGGSGADVLVGGRFADDWLDGGEGKDRIDGRAGDDTVVYFFKGGFGGSPVTVDLRRAGPQGPTADGDILVSIENVQGSVRSNRLIGNQQANELQGGAARDVLIGGGGNDALDGSFGDDRLYGGPGRDRLLADGGDLQGPGLVIGNDYVSAADGHRDLVNCGRGRDTARVDRLDRVIGCERVVLG